MRPSLQGLIFWTLTVFRRFTDLNANCVALLTSAINNEAPSFVNGKRWRNESSYGHRLIISGNSCEDRGKELEAILGSSFINICKLLHDHLIVQKGFSPFIAHNLTKSQKATCVDCCKRLLNEDNDGGAKDVYKIVHEPENNNRFFFMGVSR